MILISRRPQQTKKFALKLAKKLKGGEILALIGDLGGGKTCFTQGLALGLGIKKLVASPTFILMKIYSVKNSCIKRLCHIDLYRLKKPKDVIHLGVREYLGGKNTICVIEWADKIKNLLKPYKKTVIHFQFIDRNTRRIILKNSWYLIKRFAAPNLFFY